jgi:hypothetical protein
VAVVYPGTDLPATIKPRADSAAAGVLHDKQIDKMLYVLLGLEAAAGHPAAHQPM